MSTRNGANRVYSDETIIEEIRRAVDEHGDGETVTARVFDAHSHISSYTVRRRFGSWIEGLEAAGATPSDHQRRSARATGVHTTYDLEHLDPEDLGLSPLGGED